jgi:hypothetical protein
VASGLGGLRLSPDGLTAYFHASGRSDSVAYDDLYTATRNSVSSAFGNIVPIEGAGVNTSSDEVDPTVSGDGLTLVFARMRPPTDPVHLYVATRPLPYLPFTGVGLLPNVNDLTAELDETPFLRQDGDVLYLASSRNPANSTDIYRSTRASASGDLATPTAVSELNTNYSEVSPVVTPDDLTIYFASDRVDGNAMGSYDIWVATRASTSAAYFSALTDVAELNTEFDELPTFVSSDGCALYFWSDRDGTSVPYVATRRRN